MQFVSFCFRLGFLQWVLLDFGSGVGLVGSLCGSMDERTEQTAVPMICCFNLVVDVDVQNCM